MDVGHLGSPTKLTRVMAQLCCAAGGKLIEVGKSTVMCSPHYSISVTMFAWRMAGRSLCGVVDAIHPRTRLFRHSGNGVTRGVAVDLDGNIWAAGQSDRALYKFNPDGELLLMPVGDSMMVSLDAEGGIFGISTSERTATTQMVLSCAARTLASLYTYIDDRNPGHTITLSTGRWSIRLDGDRMMSSGTSLIGTAHCPMAPCGCSRRTAPTLAGLTAAAWSGRSFETPYRIPPANQSSYTPQNRWLEPRFDCSPKR